jgi:hypothetical protein
MRPTAAATLILLPFYALAQKPTPTHHPLNPAIAPAKDTALPVTRVSLYKNGVGFFEHTGSVTGNAQVTIDFTNSQLNDVLQSLTAIDLNGGRISGAGYNSTTPLDQQLKSLSLGLGESPSQADFYAAIRGARVSVTAPGINITGRLLSVEDRTVPTKSTDDPAPSRQFLTVVSEAGDVRTLELTPSTTVRLLDTALHTDVTRYLALLDSNRNQGLRHLTLQDNAPATGPEGSSSKAPRELHLSYLSEVPIWKSTYRILFTDTANASAAQSATLQGWSVVDNTTGTDWINVHLSLIAGAPQSFIQPLSQPIYGRRPEIPIAQQAQMTPQTYDSSIDSRMDRYRGGGLESLGSGIEGTLTDPSGAIIPNATITATNATTGERQTLTTDANGHYTFNVPPGRYKLEASSPGFNRGIQNILVSGQQTNPINMTLQVGSASQSIEVSSADMVSLPVSGRSFNSLARISGGVMAAPPPPPPPPSYEQAAQASITPTTSTAAFDDFFSYNLTEPVTILKNQSALVPILQSKITADRVTLVSYANARISQPVRALWITNTSGLTLDRGSFTIVENGSFGGEGLLDPIHPDEKRLLSYAADQAIHATTEGDGTSSRVVSLSSSKGVLFIHNAETHQVTLVLHNAASAPRTIVSEIPVVKGWKLDSETNSASSDPKPVETTPTVYRYRTEVAPGATVRLHIGANRSGLSSYYLTSTNDNQLTFILNETNHNPTLVAALQPILDARRKVADAQTAVNQTNQRIESLRSDEDRQRSNITALASSEKSSKQRFVDDLNRTEDQLKAAQTELAANTQALQAAQSDLANRIESFQIDTTL